MHHNQQFKQSLKLTPFYPFSFICKGLLYRGHAIVCRGHPLISRGNALVSHDHVLAYRGNAMLRPLDSMSWATR